MQDFQVIKKVGNHVEMSKLLNALQDIVTANLGAKEQVLDENDNQASRSVRRIQDRTFSFDELHRKKFSWGAEWMIEINPGIDYEDTFMSMVEINLFLHDERTQSWNHIVQIEMFNLTNGLFQVITIKEFLIGNQLDFKTMIDKIHHFVVQCNIVHHLTTLQPIPMT